MNDRKPISIREKVLDVLGAVCWVVLASTYVKRLLQYFTINDLALGVFVLLTALLLVVRRPSRAQGSVAMLVLAWGTVALSLVGLRATLPGLRVPGTLMQLAGLAGAIYSLACLGRSFGIAPANRGVVTRGAYRLVRHPLYAMETVDSLGYLLAYPSFWNGVIWALLVTGQCLRIVAEERVLAADPAYQAYAAQVRWRLLPGVW